MYSRPLLPKGTPVPQGCDGPGFRLRPLLMTDAKADFEAVLDAAARLRGLMEPGATWPDGLTLHENTIDLAWHEREFTIGHSFAWTVEAPDTTSILGCCYLNPPDKAGFDAVAFWWVRDSAHQLDAPVGAAFRAMLATLPLTQIGFPGRDIQWADWAGLPPH